MTGKIFCIFVCGGVRMYMCLQARIRNFYPFDTKFGTQAGPIKSQVEFEDVLCGSYRSGNTFLENLETS